MRRYYISHPYTGNEEKNRAEAARIQRELQERYPEVLFLNPLAMFAPLVDLPYEQVMLYCLEMLKSCDEVIMAGDYVYSKGCLREFDEAIARRIPTTVYTGDKDAPLMREPR